MTRQALLALIFVDISCRGASSSDDYDVLDADRGIPKRGAGESGSAAGQLWNQSRRRDFESNSD
jgi:hypothetical protein